MQGVGIVQSIWPPEFDGILRNACRHVPSDDAIDPDASLSSLGVGSLELLGMIVAIEQAYAIVFPDELIAGDHFGTARSAWEAVQPLVAGGDPGTDRRHDRG
jgi:acyl carrier protein